MKDISIIIPAKDEANRISSTLEDYSKEFPQAEILVVINGTTDSTESMVKRAEKKNKNMRHIVFKEKIGKGGAIINGLKESRGNIVGFTDADGSTTAHEFRKLIDKVQKDKDFDGAIASRRIKGAEINIKQPLKRVLAGRMFNLLVRTMFFLPYKDTQCGAKVLKRSAAKALEKKMGVTDWAFDVDFLYLAKKNKIRMAEVPIRWIDKEGSKLDLKKTSVRMFLSIIRLRLIYSPIGKSALPRSLASLVYHMLYDDIEKKPNTVLIFLWKDLKHPKMGGSEIYMFSQAKTWKERGFNPIFLTAQFKGCKTKEEIEGCTVYRVGGKYTTYLFSPIFFLSKLRKVADFVIDVENGIPFFTPLYSRKPSVLCVYHVHRHIFFRELPAYIAWFPYLLELYAMPLIYRNKTVMTISKDTKAELEGIGFKDSQIKINYPGVDFGRRVKAEKFHAPTAIYLGRIEKYKRVDLIVKMFAKSAHKDSRLIIAGTGSELDSIRALVKKLKLEKRVSMPGFVEENKKYELLAKSWVLLQASEKEGWGISVIEANMCNTPAIAFDAPGLSESILDGKNGYIASGEEDYVEKLDRVFSKKARFFGLERHAAQFDWNSAAKNTLDLLLAEKKRRQ